MPPLPLPDEMMKKLSIHVLEKQFPPPYVHRAIAIKQANERGDPQNTKKVQQMLNRYCN